MFYDLPNAPETPPNRPEVLQPVVQVDSGLNLEQLNWIVEYGEKLERGRLRVGGRWDYERVTAGVAGFPLNDETRWLYDHMAKIGTEVNDEHYHFDVTGFAERMFYLRYEPGEFIEWHDDHGPRTEYARKLTMVLQLTEPFDYDGGDLEMFGHSVRTFKQRGLVSIFPAYQTHRATPVTRGTRLALSMFLVGPNFR